MYYAPVLIPTLNRHEHLKRCLESLSRCTYADQTEVYVALDYPPSEKYVEGWKKNKEFLESCGNMGFKKLHVIEREENYGTWRPGDKGNGRCLNRWAREVYDRYICTEDDNVFSPNFLEFMDKGLEQFEDDDTVLALCGYRHFASIKYSDNTFFRQNVDVCGWGVGKWRAKEVPSSITYRYFRDRLSLKSFFKVYKRAGIEKAIYFLACCTNKWNGRKIDIVKTVYAILNDMDEIMPTVAMVQNIGMDDSGENFRHMPKGIKDKFENQKISEERHFDFVGTGFEFYEENQAIYKSQYPNKLPKKKAIGLLLKTFAKLFIYR